MPGTNWVVRGKLAQGGVGIALDVAKGAAHPGRDEGASSAIREAAGVRGEVLRKG